MNERIKELVEKAGIYIAYDNRAVTDKEIEFLAELIVRKCVGIADDYVKDCTCEEHVNCKHPRSAIGRKIREHFGVEEQVNDSKELHTCPYREEIHNDYESLCDCDEEQQHQCAMDI